MFGKPISAYQLTQQKLAEMALEINRAPLVALHIGRMKDDGHAPARARQPRQDGQRPRRARGLPHGAHDPRRQRHHARVSGHPAHEQPRVRAHLRGHARGAHARRRPGADRRERVRPHASLRRAGPGSTGGGPWPRRRRLDQRETGDERHREEDRDARARPEQPGSPPSTRGAGRGCRSRRPRASGPITSPTPFVVVARPEIAPRSPGGISLKRSPHARVITVPPAIATTKIRPRYQACHSLPRPPARSPIRRRPTPRDDAREPDTVADRAGDERGHDVAAGNRREHVGRGRERLVEADRDVEDDERSGTGERPLPGGVRHEERRDVAVPAEDAPGMRHIGSHPLEHASVAAVLGDEDIGTMHAAPTTPAATRNGAGRQKWKR